MRKKIRIIQIGTGHDHAFAAVDSLTKLTDLFEYLGFVVCEHDEAMYQKQEKHYRGLRRLTLEEALNRRDVDAVAVETYDHDLVRYAQLFVEKGVPVYMDKPGSQDPNDFDALLKSAKEKNVVLEIGYMYRFNPAVRWAKQIVDSGKIGTVYSVEAHMDCDHDPEKRLWLKDFRGGMTFFLGCHLVDLILRFQGIPDRIIPFNTATGYGDCPSEDVGMAVFQYPGGISFFKTSALEPGGFLRRQLVICGTEGTIVIEPLEHFVGTWGSYIDTKATLFLRGDAPRLAWNREGETVTFPPFERYDPLFEEFFKLVSHEKEPDCSLEYESVLHRVLLNACGIDCDYRKKSF